MSLQLVANHLAQKGRGPDSTLVHMSNREVAGLNALAQKHGGQLSVNPQTGLPEAGFLDSILPAVAGFGLSAVSGGMIDPITAGAIVGGITALDSKDLSKGLTAGLGAWGGAGMAGGLGALGGATDPTNVASAQYGKGFDAFTKAPIDSLSTLGGGSALKGSLPILAGLAPAAADMMDSPDEEDTPPEQKKGYIRKYAFDPVTGQYKQVGAYEAGGDPNKDVTSEAGTAGSYGGVREPEYQQPKGMAEGGTASDSERIYDYLMGRGPNPMQFTHTTAPQVDYNVNKPNVPITPTTQILETPFDQYGNIKQTGPGGYSPEQREAFLNETLSDYGTNSVTGNPFTRGEVLSLTGDRKKEVEARFAEAHPIKQGFIDFAKVLAPGSIATKILGGVTSLLPRSGVDLNRDYFADNPDNSGLIKTAKDFGGNFYTPSISGPEAGRSGLPPSPPTQAAVTTVDNSAAEASAKVEAQARADADAGGDTTSWSGYARDHATDAQGGYLQHGKFDQRMAHGGIANLHQYNLGSYSDGGRLLKGPGDGVSDDIPATIGHGQPARLADGEFVIPARIVSEIGNGSTDAGARELYKMMDRIQAGRRKTVGKDQVAKNSKSVRHLPA